MSGGSATVAFAHEDTFAGTLVDADADGTPEYYEPGRNLTIQNAELTNVLQDLEVPDAVEPVESLAQNLEGAFAIEGTMSADVQADLEATIFNDAGTAFTHGLALTSRWFLGIDHWSETAERELFGVTPIDYSIQWNEGSPPTWSLTCVYSHEEYGTVITPSSITAATDGSTVAGHGVELTLDASVEAEVQSCNLSISNIARFERGPPRRPLNAIIAGPKTTLDATVLFRDSSHIETAYGLAAATEPQDSVDSISGSLSFSAAAGAVSDYSLPKLAPETYNWSDILTTDSSLAEQLNFRVNGGVSVA